jgi:hypothetical protein
MTAISRFKEIALFAARALDRGARARRDYAEDSDGLLEIERKFKKISGQNYTWLFNETVNIGRIVALRYSAYAPASASLLIETSSRAGRVGQTVNVHCTELTLCAVQPK